MPHDLTPPTPLVPGTTVASRFTLHHQAGRGGMGFVYRATDSLSGQEVALKLLHAESSDALQRFSREAHVLASLHHPGIVSYVAHGIAEDGRPFLAMEWLEGEDLAQRLSRQPLSLHESLSLLRNAAQALALAHQRGVIHRDIKPSNLFLRHGRPEDVMLLDFGLARHVLPSSALTASQLVLGTPGYMAPEQASSQSALTPSADIFSLGCVLYECLTGKPPFAAPLFVAALAKILFAEPEPLRSQRPELPLALEELLQRMLAKAPERRFPDASSLLTALAQLEERLETAPSAAAALSPPVLRLAGAEQHLVSVLLAAPFSSVQLPSEPQDSQRSLLQALRTLLSPHGAQVELLADGSLVATLVASHGSATDPATLAARCALMIQERWPQAAVVLTTGRGRLDQHLPVGEAMDRAGQLLRQGELLPGDSSSTVVLLDEVTAGLLGSHFQLSRTQSGLFQLLGENLGADASRPLLGKPTSCVGREQELALLELTFNTCVQEPVAQTVLVKAPAGTGKSRLRHEFLRRLQRQERPVLVLLGRGDPMSAGSADGLLAQALRRLCDILGAEAMELRRERLAQRLARHLPAAQAQETVEFLGELCGIPFPDAHSPRLRAARGNPQLMSAQVGRAFVAFLQAECAHHPVLLMLEDLHWGDVLSVRLMDEALRALAEQPLMVLALARPEVGQVFPAQWVRQAQEVPLRGLSRKAGIRLVQEVLGADVPDSLVERLVEQSTGNALFLEELIRGVAEGLGEAAPQTVLAMLQARLMRLKPEPRQVLLTASILGRTFWQGGVQALLGDEGMSHELAQRLGHLVEQELVEPQPDSRFPGEAEYRFRHALVRDAAYALVPEGQKPAGHQLAGQWLEQRGESDARVLAEHYHRGRQPERAAHFYAEAAERLFERRDLPSTLRCIEAARACTPSRQVESRLRALQALIFGWVEDLSKTADLGLSVLPELNAGDALWCTLLGYMIGGGALAGRHEEVARLGRLLLGTSAPEAGFPAAYFEALSFLCYAATWFGDRQQTTVLLERMVEEGTKVLAPEAQVRGWVCLARNFFHYLLDSHPWQALVSAQEGMSDFLEAGAESSSLNARALSGQALAALGDLPAALEQLRQCLEISRRMEHSLPLSVARTHLAATLAGGSEPGQWEEARVIALEELAHDMGLLLHMGWAHYTLARVAAHRGELTEAEVQARKACEVLLPFPPYRLFPRATLGTVLLAQGRAAEAREIAALGVRELETVGGAGTASVGLHLVLAQACFAEGDLQAGEAALRQALQCLRERARDIPDEAARERFLHQVPENARTLELARQRWGEAEV